MAKSIQHTKDYSHLPATASGARYLGSLYYFTGKPCKAGHVGLRYASSSNCVHCIEDKRGVVFDTEKDRFSEKNINLAIAAMADGNTKYFSETPCPLGHLERYTSSNNCVECNSISMQRRKESARWSRIKKLYGIDQNQFDGMVLAQKAKCSICDADLNPKNTHIDHCHTTGAVRELLCSKCNQAIGLVNESLETLEKIKQYLMRHGKC
jgi:hypothetical protein